MPLVLASLSLLSSEAIYGQGISLSSSNFNQTLPPGSDVAGNCHGVLTPFGTTQDLTTVQTDIADALLADGETWSTAQNQQMAANLQEQNQILQEETNSLEQLAAAQSAEKTALQSGAPLTAQTTLPNGQQITVSSNAPSAGCNQTARKSAWASGVAAGEQTAGSLGQALTNYNVSNKDGPETITNLASEGPADFDASSIFGSASGSTGQYPTTQEAAQAIANLTNPVPPVQLTSDQKSTSAGVQWSAEQNEINAKMSMSQNALAQIAAWHQPTINGSSFTAEWTRLLQDAQTQTANQSATGSSGLPPAPGSNGSKISDDGALDLAVQARYANPKWYTQLQVQSPTGVLKDLFEIGGIGLRIHYQEMVMAQYLAALSAEEYSQQDVKPLVVQVQNTAASAMQQQVRNN